MQRRQHLAWLGLAPAAWLAAPQRLAAQAASTAAPASRRVALVIGNAAYAQLPLPNPENDARLIAATMSALGFAVDLQLNLKVRDFKRVLREFGRRMDDDDSASVFFYAGHGMQIARRNYLLPTDVNLRDEGEIKDESIDIEDALLSRIDRVRPRARIFIIDACRDNPFGALPNRPERPRKGLAVTGASGALIAFSAGPGSVSEDGPVGGNGVYTRRLVQALGEPGLPVESLLKQVAIRVREDTQGRQVPWINTSMQVDFVFNPVGAAAPLAVAPAPAPAGRALQVHVLADRQLNTDQQQRSATLAMRVYVLRDTAVFLRAGFDALYDQDEVTLGADLLGREIVHLRPGSQRELSVRLGAGARAVGVFGAFREIGQSQWRAVLPLPAQAAQADLPGLQIDAQARRVQLAWQPR